MSVDIDVINSTLAIIIGLTITICTRSRCGLTSTRQLVAAAIAVHDAAAFGNFLESVRVAHDIVRFAIFADEFGFFLSCQFNRFTVGLFLVVSRNRQSRLCLEDVLVRIFRLSIRVESVAALRAGVPAGCRLAVEVLAELVAVWRCGVDFPVAARASRDGILLCLRQILERTVLALYVDDNSIVIRRLSNQCTIIMGVIQYDCAALTRRGQVDILMSRDAIDMDVARSLDIDALGVSRDAVADGDVLARDADSFVRVDNARVVSAAANRDIASVDLDILQGNRVTDITSNVDFRIAGIDDEARMLQVLFLDETTDCRSSLRDIVPFGLSTEANRDDWAGVIRLFVFNPGILRITVVPLDVVVVNGRTILPGEFRAFVIVFRAFWASDPVIAVRMLWISRRSSDATAAAADDQLILLWRAGQRVLKRCRDCSEIRIARVVRAFRRPLSHCLGTSPSLRLPCQIVRKVALLRCAQLIIR